MKRHNCPECGLRIRLVKDENNEPKEWRCEVCGYEMPYAGSCCNCGEAKSDVRNFVSLHFKAPESGKGWGCFQCHLPNDGAMAVLCDACMDQVIAGAPIQNACVGYPGENRRVPKSELTEPFIRPSDGVASRGAAAMNPQQDFFADALFWIIRQIGRLVDWINDDGTRPTVELAWQTARHFDDCSDCRAASAPLFDDELLMVDVELLYMKPEITVVFQTYPTIDEIMVKLPVSEVEARALRDLCDVPNRLAATLWINDLARSMLLHGRTFAGIDHKSVRKKVTRPAAWRRKN